MYGSVRSKVGLHFGWTASLWPLYGVPLHAAMYVVFGGLGYYCYPYVLALTGLGVVTWIMALADADACSLFKFLRAKPLLACCFAAGSVAIVVGAAAATIHFHPSEPGYAVIGYLLAPAAPPLLFRVFQPCSDPPRIFHWFNP